MYLALARQTDPSVALRSSQRPHFPWWPSAPTSSRRKTDNDHQDLFFPSHSGFGASKYRAKVGKHPEATQGRRKRTLSLPDVGTTTSQPMNAGPGNPSGGGRGRRRRGRRPPNHRGGGGQGRDRQNPGGIYS